MLYVLAALALSANATDTASLRVSLDVVAAEHLTMTTETLDEGLGAYRVSIATAVTGGEYHSDTRSYLLMTDLEPSEAMIVTLAGGAASFTFAPEALAFDLTGTDAADVIALLELLREDFAYASR